ncbi:MAG TPA: HIT domain-containing protein [Kribbella sp.]|jgi:histidine triad (HIT) family protein
MATAPFCAFCEIMAGRGPADVVAEWPDALAFKPRNPVTEGHTLVVPRTHVRNATVDPMVAGATMANAARLTRRMISAEQMSGANIITSVGRVATQSVFHLHLHIVPRRDNDGLHLPWTGQAS